MRGRRKKKERRWEERRGRERRKEGGKEDVIFLEMANRWNRCKDKSNWKTPGLSSCLNSNDKSIV